MNVFRSNIYPEGTEFTCPVCGKRFISGTPNIQCLVVHPNNSCCHYTDKEIKGASPNVSKSNSRTH